MKGVFWGFLFFATLTFAQNQTESEKLQNHPPTGGITCKTCHSCDVPTKQDPCLNPCPRDMMITVNQSPEKGPDIVKLDELSNKYMPVIFSHKVHAQMSQMSGGCKGCHHYNTAGPILGCSNCHSTKRQREDISKPDLQAAYHRQCINCHKEWSHSTDCVSCHALKGTTNLVEQKSNKVDEKNHPNVQQPEKLIFETNYKKGNIVTFFHEQHVNLFGAECVNCHQKENCTRCHDKEVNSKVISSTLPIKIQKPAAEHHQPCFKCHANDPCSKCHQDKAMEPFNHKISTGWALNRFHEKLECTKCHVGNKIVRLNKECTSCHNSFASGKFEHSVTGLKVGQNTFNT